MTGYIDIKFYKAMLSYSQWNEEHGSIASMRWHLIANCVGISHTVNQNHTPNFDLSF